jgi:thiol:disulfide interchange protein DsbA
MLLRNTSKHWEDKSMIEYFRKAKSHLFLASSLFLTIGYADDHLIFEEGRHYKTLGLAERIVAEDNRVEVLEVFAYSCNHCFNFEPYLDQFDGSKADYIDVVKMPVIFNEAYKMHARIYYTAESLGNLDVMHTEFYRAIHLDRKMLMDEDEIFTLFEKHGVTEEEFQSRFRSFTVESKINRAQRLTRKYKIRSTPSMIVNGKYIATGPATRTFEDMIAVSKHLAEMEYRASNQNSN